MKSSDLDRRDFARWSLAALGGALAGTAIGRSAADEEKDAKKKNPLLSEPHVCRGLNTCKNKGKGGKNECAGQGACHTVEAHSCHGENVCRGQGGCGDIPGENECKGKGECGVPLSDKIWKKARARFEELMKKEGKKVGPAPKKKG